MAVTGAGAAGAGCGSTVGALPFSGALRGAVRTGVRAVREEVSTGRFGALSFTLSDGAARSGASAAGTGAGVAAFGLLLTAASVSATGCGPGAGAAAPAGTDVPGTSATVAAGTVVFCRVAT